MKLFFMSLAVLAISFVLTSCAQLLGPAPTDTGMVRKAIEDAGAKFVAAVSRGDAVALAAFYQEDAKLLPPNSQMVTGRQHIQEFWQAFLQTGTVQLTLETKDVDSRSDLAYEVGGYTLKIQPKSGSAMTDMGKYVTIWKRQTDGSWKIAVDTWNSDAPLPTK
ncbi:SgcJ/EcaC family oxidoreductase [Candidatus Acetothermia bacterium]|nr:SgcJ/EcaC family oxidoreductase [Candidatus Acetothermia bacterium]